MKLPGQAARHDMELGLVPGPAVTGQGRERRGPVEFIGMVDMALGPHTTARLLDLVPGRYGKAYRGWLKARGGKSWMRARIAALDPFQVYKNAIDDLTTRQQTHLETRP